MASHKIANLKRNSITFLSKVGRFYIVGAIGLVVNYLVSSALSNNILSNLSYTNAMIIGIFISLTLNYILNKLWTFDDKDFSPRHALKQYGVYVALSSFGAVFQFVLVYVLVESAGMQYGLALLPAVALGSLSNFLLNKKLTFGEKIWN
jgi:dolichol-phosphate mannosyltransferase